MENAGEEMPFTEMVQQGLNFHTTGGNRGPEPYPGHVLPLPLVPVAPYISGRDTPRDEAATPIIPSFADPTHPLNWEGTGNRPQGEAEVFLVVDDHSPPKGSLVPEVRMVAAGRLPLCEATEPVGFVLERGMPRPDETVLEVVSLDATSEKVSGSVVLDVSACLEGGDDNSPHVRVENPTTILEIPPWCWKIPFCRLVCVNSPDRSHTQM